MAGRDHVSPAIITARNNRTSAIPIKFEQVDNRISLFFFQAGETVRFQKHGFQFVWASCVIYDGSREVFTHDLDQIIGKGFQFFDGLIVHCDP